MKKAYKVTYSDSDSDYDIAYFSDKETADIYAKEQVKHDIYGKWFEKEDIDVQEVIEKHASTFVVRRKNNETGYLFSIDVYEIKIHNNAISASIG